MPIKYSECCKEPLANLSSQNIKMCANCLKEFPWELKEGQQSTLTKEKGYAKGSSSTGRK